MNEFAEGDFNDSNFSEDDPSDDGTYNNDIT
jgi:hypothetical protein